MVVLVVEDSAAMRELICRSLKRIANVVVIEATDGVDGLKKLTDIQPDVIMTDINMPEMDGLSFIERIRQQPVHKNTPVIVLTVENAKEDRMRAKALGVNTYVTKPIRHNDLVAAISSVLEGAKPVDGSAGETSAMWLRIDYEDTKDLLNDYAATLSRGEIVVAHRRALDVGTPVRLALTFPSLVEPIQLDGVVRAATSGDEAMLTIELVDKAQREQLAYLVDRIRAAAGG